MLVRFPEAPGGAVIREQFRLVKADEGLRVTEFSEYIEADQEIRVARGQHPKIGLVLLCFDGRDQASDLAQIFMGQGWRVGEPQQSGMDLAKKMRMVTRSLPQPLREGVIAESYYVVATETEPERAREQLLTSARAVASGPARPSESE